MPMHSGLAEHLRRDGYAHADRILTMRDVGTLLSAIEAGDVVRLCRRDSQFGARNLLALSAVRTLAESEAIRSLIEPILGARARAVRAALFDKAPGANWPVLWHQDLALALAERHELHGWGPWSIKAGIAHAHAPAEVLAAMIAVRFHLDACGLENGPLRVLPGTHCLGRVDRGRIGALRARIAEVACEAAAGDVLLMRPLLLHASSPARAPSHRRVLHIEFAPDAPLLPHPLRWAH